LLHFHYSLSSTIEMAANRCQCYCSLLLITAIVPLLLLIWGGNVVTARCTAYLSSLRRQQENRWFQRAPRLFSQTRCDSSNGASSAAHTTIRSICGGVFVQERKRQSQQSSNESNAPPFRSVQTRTAGFLLQNMTRATQTHDMFQNPDALWGYARSKFYVRARLIADVLGQLQDHQDQSEEGSTVVTHLFDGEDVGLLRGLMLDRLQNVRSACSIGCGPGNDAVGLVAVLKSMSTSGPACEDVKEIGSRTPTLERMVLLDYAMNEWKSAILSPLVDSILIPGGYVGSVKMAHCDVKKSLFNSVINSDVRQALGCIDQSKDNRRLALQTPCDIYLISYLLSETKGKWEDFVIEVVNASPKGTLFYFAEPSPTPLRRLKELFYNAEDNHNGGLDFVVLRPTVWLAMKI